MCGTSSRRQKRRRRPRWSSTDARTHARSDRERNLCRCETFDVEAEDGCCGCAVGGFAKARWKIREEELKPKTGFESGSSPTLKVIRERITRAFDAIRVPPQEPLPPQLHEFVYTQQHEARFQERAKKLTLESLACCSSESCHGSVWEIKAPTQTAEELINEIVRGSV